MLNYEKNNRNEFAIIWWIFWLLCCGVVTLTGIDVNGHATFFFCSGVKHVRKLRCILRIINVCYSFIHCLLIALEKVLICFIVLLSFELLLLLFCYRGYWNEVKVPWQTKHKKKNKTRHTTNRQRRRRWWWWLPSREDFSPEHSSLGSMATTVE